MQMKFRIKSALASTNGQLLIRVTNTSTQRLNGVARKRLAQVKELERTGEWIDSARPCYPNHRIVLETHRVIKKKVTSSRNSRRCILTTPAFTCFAIDSRLKCSSCVFVAPSCCTLPCATFNHFVSMLAFVQRKRRHVICPIECLNIKKFEWQW